MMGERRKQVARVPFIFIYRSYMSKRVGLCRLCLLGGNCHKGYLGCGRRMIGERPKQVAPEGGDIYIPPQKWMLSHFMEMT
jgi:hypothetical protein